MNKLKLFFIVATFGCVFVFSANIGSQAFEPNPDGSGCPEGAAPDFNGACGIHLPTKSGDFCKESSIAPIDPDPSNPTKPLCPPEDIGLEPDRLMNKKDPCKGFKIKEEEPPGPSGPDPAPPFSAAGIGGTDAPLGIQFNPCDPIEKKYGGPDPSPEGEGCGDSRYREDPSESSSGRAPASNPNTPGSEDPGTDSSEDTDSGGGKQPPEGEQPIPAGGIDEGDSDAGGEKQPPEDEQPMPAGGIDEGDDDSDDDGGDGDDSDTPDPPDPKSGPGTGGSPGNGGSGQGDPCGDKDSSGGSGRGTNGSGGSRHGNGAKLPFDPSVDPNLLPDGTNPLDPPNGLYPGGPPSNTPPGGCSEDDPWGCKSLTINDPRTGEQINLKVRSPKTTDAQGSKKITFTGTDGDNKNVHVTYEAYPGNEDVNKRIFAVFKPASINPIYKRLTVYGYGTGLKKVVFGEVEEFFKNGFLLKRISINFYENGSKKAVHVETFESGKKKTDSLTTYNPDGSVYTHIEADYENGVIVSSTTTTYNEDGTKTVEEDSYQDGKLHTTTTTKFSMSGKITKKTKEWFSVSGGTTPYKTVDCLKNPSQCN